MTNDNIKWLVKLDAERQRQNNQVNSDGSRNESALNQYFTPKTRDSMEQAGVHLRLAIGHLMAADSFDLAIGVEHVLDDLEGPAEHPH